MKRALILLVVALILVVATVGFFRNWFVVSGSRGTESNKVRIDLTVDPDQMKQDAAKVVESAEELTDKVKDETPKLIDRN